MNTPMPEEPADTRKPHDPRGGWRWPTVAIICARCGKPVRRKGARPKFCSDNCKARFHNGEIAQLRREHRAREAGLRIGDSLVDKGESENNPFATH